MNYIVRTLYGLKPNVKVAKDRVITCHKKIYASLWNRLTLMPAEQSQ